MRNTKRWGYATALAAIVVMLGVQPSVASDDPVSPVDDTAQVLEELLQGLAGSADPGAGLGGVSSDPLVLADGSTVDPGAGIGGITSDSLAVTQASSSVSTPLYVCLSSSNIPIMVASPKRVLTTSTVNCSGTPAGVTFRLRLEATTAADGI